MKYEVYQIQLNLIQFNLRTFNYGREESTASTYNGKVICHVAINMKFEVYQIHFHLIQFNLRRILRQPKMAKLFDVLQSI